MVNGDPTVNADGTRNDAATGSTTNGPFSVARITPPRLDIADYNQIDPFKQSLDDLNKRLNAFEKVFDVTGKLLDRLPSYEFNQNKEYYNQASPFLQDAIGAENQYNQDQFTQQIDRGAPGARNTVFGNMAIANNFAKGRFSDDVLNSAFEVNSRGLAAANLNAAGYGDTAYTDDLNDKFSVMNRLNLQQYGIQTSSQLAGQAMGFVSQPARLQTAEQFAPRLSYSPSQALLGQANTQYANSVVDATNTANMGIQQEQFRTNQVQGVYNTRAAMDMSAQTQNAANGLATQQLNYGAYMNDQAIAQSQADRQLANQAAAQGQQLQQEQQNAQAGAALVGAAIQSPFGQSILGSAGEWLQNQWNGSPTVQSEEENAAFNAGADAATAAQQTATVPSAQQDQPSSFSQSLEQATAGDADIAAQSAQDSWNQAANEASQADFNSNAVNYKSRSATTQQVNAAFGGLNNTALQGGLAYNYNKNAGTQFTSGLEKNKQPVDPMVKNALTYFGMGAPVSPTMSQLTSTNGESPKAALISGLNLPGDSLSKNLIGKLTQDSVAMLNVSPGGDMQIGMSPEKWGIDVSTLPISKESGSKASEYGRGIASRVTQLQFNDWKTNMTEAPKLINQVLKDQGVFDENESAEVSFTGPMTRTVSDLARGRKTYDWVTKQLGEFGVGVNLQNLDGDDDAKAEMGALFYDTVKQWKDLTPEKRTVNMTQMMVAFKGSLGRVNGTK